MPDFVKVAGLSEVPAGTVREVDVKGRRIALANIEGRLFAIDNVCIHRGGPLGQGFLDGYLVQCPWHGWHYDMRTGECAFNSNAKLASYEVKVEGGDILIAV